MTGIEYDEEIHSRSIDELFAAVDTDGSNDIDMEEFTSIVHVMNNQNAT